jgi:hypothetical protein
MVTWGATALAFQAAQKGDTGSFVAGAEGGAIFKCLLDHNEAMCHDFQQQLTDGKVGPVLRPVENPLSIATLSLSTTNTLLLVYVWSKAGTARVLTCCNQRIASTQP